MELGFFKCILTQPLSSFQPHVSSGFVSWACLCFVFPFGFQSLPFILAKPLAVKTSVFCQDVPALCQALAGVPPTPSCAWTSRGSVGTGLTCLMLIILSWSSSPLLPPPSTPGRLLRYLCCSDCLLGNAPSPSHSEIGCGSSSGSRMWMSSLREVKKLAQGHTAVKRQSQDLNQIWLQISDFLLLVTQAFSDYTQ